MNNERFRYLMDNNPEKVITEKGVKIRKLINPVFVMLLKLINPYKLNIERKEKMPKNEPTIYVASHGFRDDILNSYLTIKDNVYVLFGVIDQFFKTIDGLKLWLSGVVLVDRENKESRAASKPKMERTLKLGASVIDFFEATWNLSDNLLVAKPHLGIYDVAKSTGIEVAPITTHVETKRIRSKCHSILGERYDITKITTDGAFEIINLMTKNLLKASDLLIYNDSNSKKIKDIISKLLVLLNNSKEDEPYFNFEKIKSIIESVSIEASQLKTTIDQIIIEEDLDEILKNIMKRCSDILRVVMYAKKIVAINGLRDRIATHKYELIEKYSNFSNIPRSQLEKKESLLEQRKKYKAKLIKQVKYYNYNREQSYLYKDPTEFSEEEVFAPLDKVELTRGNAFVLSISKNRN